MFLVFQSLKVLLIALMYFVCVCVVVCVLYKGECTCVSHSTQLKSRGDCFGVGSLLPRHGSGELRSPGPHLLSILAGLSFGDVFLLFVAAVTNVTHVVAKVAHTFYSCSDIPREFVSVSVLFCLLFSPLNEAVDIVESLSSGQLLEAACVPWLSVPSSVFTERLPNLYL